MWIKKHYEISFINKFNIIIEYSKKERERQKRKRANKLMNITQFHGLLDLEAHVPLHVK